MIIDQSRGPAMVARSMRLPRCAREATVTIRAGAEAFSRSSSRLVSRNGARWLTAKVISYPSADRCEFRRKQPGVVDQEIDPVVRGQDLGGQAPHLRERGEIGERGLDLRRPHPLGDEPARRLGAVAVAAGHDHPHPGAGEAQRRIEPDPGTRPGDDRDPLGWCCSPPRLACPLLCPHPTLPALPKRGNRQRRWVRVPHAAAL